MVLVLVLAKNTCRGINTRHSQIRDTGNGLSCEEKLRVFEHMIEEYDELPHDRGSGDFLRFSLSEQTLIKGF